MERLVKMVNVVRLVLKEKLVQKVSKENRALQVPKG
jgi:hypothetical protein